MLCSYSMKIGLIASIWITVPPKDFGFGAQEYLQYYIAKNLVEKGHDVTLFATGDSKTQAKLISVTPEPVIDIRSSDKKIKDIFELMNVSEAYKHAKDFDIIHNHLLPYGLLFADLFKTPTVHTLHHKIYEERADYYLYQKYKNQQYMSISNAQRKIVPDLNYIATVYNGTDATFHKFKAKPDADYLLYIGRMKRYKGIHTAITLAKKLGLKLKIASPLPSKNQADYDEVIEYWEQDIKPQLGQDIEHIDMLSGKSKVALYQDAKALIFPVEREEPFGMTLIEAMSCGTPVIAYGVGAMPEIITDGKTGYLVNADPHRNTDYQTKNNGFSGLYEALQKLYALSEKEYQQMRLDSRHHVEENFTIDKMVDNYEKVYKEVLSYQS